MMKKLFSVLVSFVCAVSIASAGEREVVDVSPQKVTSLLESKSPPVVIDVRTQKEYRAGHIKGAKLIDVKGDNFAEELAKLDRNQAYIVHCRSGGRSARALNVFKKLGFTKVYHMNEGMNAWVKAKLPVVKE